MIDELLTMLAPVQCQVSRRFKTTSNSEELSMTNSSQTILKRHHLSMPKQPTEGDVDSILTSTQEAKCACTFSSQSHCGKFALLTRCRSILG